MQAELSDKKTALDVDTSTSPIFSVCTMGTPECDDELCLFLRCLRVFHPDLPVIVGCTSSMIDDRGRTTSQAFSGFRMDKKIEWVPCLDQYGSIDRTAMERQRGVWFPSRHTDFMMEKANLMERALMLRVEHGGIGTETVAFLDCDVVLLGELPRLPRGTVVALSPHRISRESEMLFGRYNGGFLAAADPLVLHEWRRAAQFSRYFDQAALESVACGFAATLHEIPPQHNYGYWRLFQTRRGENPLREGREFSIACVGPRRELTLCYEGAPLRSIHTHFFHSGQQSRHIRAFNGLIKRWIHRCVCPTAMTAGVTTAAFGVCRGGASIMANTSYKKCFDTNFLTGTY
ncbi:uncharacterized protein TM35_000311710 [Trypanosoma theileri]|uniref:Nucleotide-diphospho-sugar transferase domain-containing protein n=1 Tax=Trypanosoma theileri TaxID=67003 RepID=A0A1X0NMM8_9TRYP|nr:uncharacterized protein TM35_000311710 [Trypanosoma theileri]ORC85985.1 hypothetical protein TM35_000311710 [Trypanosoma theileri]